MRRKLKRVAIKLKIALKQKKKRNQLHSPRSTSTDWKIRIFQYLAISSGYKTDRMEIIYRSGCLLLMLGLLKVSLILPVRTLGTSRFVKRHVPEGQILDSTFCINETDFKKNARVPFWESLCSLFCMKQEVIRVPYPSKKNNSCFFFRAV